MTCPTANVPTAPRVTARTVKLPDLAIVVDTREQRPLIPELTRLMDAEDLPKFTIVEGTLHTGDYSVRGLESSICFERKSVDDLVNTLNPKTGAYEPDWTKEWRRFNREVERMRYFNRAVILCEGSWTDIASHRYQSLIEPKSVMGMIRAIERERGISVRFCGSRAAMARYIVREAGAYFHLRFKKFFRPSDAVRAEGEA